jgi:hypothetical protein
LPVIYVETVRAGSEKDIPQEAFTAALKVDL